MKRTSRALYKDISEHDWQEQVFDCLHLNGWRVAHFRAGRTQSGGWSTPVAADGKGFPDLFALHVRSGDAFGAELKTEYAPATPEQLEWLEGMRAAGLGGYLWRPSMVDTVFARIRKPRMALTRERLVEAVRADEVLPASEIG